MDEVRTKLSPSPLAEANFFSRWFFLWLGPLLAKGYRSQLKQEDLYEPLEEHTSVILTDELEGNWRKELERATKRRPPQLWRAVAATFFWKFVPHWTLCFFTEGSRLIAPIFLGYLLTYFSADSTMTINEAYLYAALVGGCSLFQTLTRAPYLFGCMKIGMSMRISCSGLIYKKALTLSNAAMTRTTTGQIVNLLSNDVQRFDRLAFFIQYFVYGPAITICILGILWNDVGPVILAGFIFMMLLVPLQYVFAKYFAKLRSNTAAFTDERIKSINEIILGMRVIKMYIWEKPFGELIASIRRKEIDLILKRGYAISVNALCFFLSFKLCFLLLLILLVSMKPSIESDAVSSILNLTISSPSSTSSPSFFFSSSSFNATMEKYMTFTLSIPRAPVLFKIFALLQFLAQIMFHFVPNGIQSVQEVKIVLKRIETYLLLPDLETHSVASGDEKDTVVDAPIILDDVVASWKLKIRDKSRRVENENAITIGRRNGSDPTIGKKKRRGLARLIIPLGENLPSLLEGYVPNTLKNISLTFKEGELVIIVGAVAAGKSSLLMSLLGEIPIVSASKLKIVGEIAYVAQQPWVFSASIRQNITFGKPYDGKKFEQVLRDCDLLEDLSTFPDREMTHVGERGVTLSGGQKARVSLARAAYAEADLYLLDDPLSAVDARVSKHLFEKCIRQSLEKKVRILATHQLQFLPFADHIIMLDDGKIENQGSYRELREQGVDFTQCMSKNDEEEERPKESATSKLRKRRKSTTSISSHRSVGNAELNEKKKEERAEVLEKGVVAWGIYLKYFISGGGLVGLPLLVMANFLVQGLYAYSDFWLSDWTKDEENVRKGNAERIRYIDDMTIGNISILNATMPTTGLDYLYNSRQRLYAYIGILLGVLLVALARGIIIIFITVKASSQLHDKMFESVTNAPILFFDTNPSGRILNRFSQDIGRMDDLLPQNMLDFFQFGMNCVMFIIVAGIVNPWVFIPTIPLGIVLIIFRAYYLASSREIKRIEAAAKSHVFSYLGATLNGLVTMRAYKSQKIFLHEFHTAQDVHTASWLAFLTTSRWLGLRLDLGCAIFISCVSLFSVWLAENLDGGLVGLSISYSIALVGKFQWALRLSAEIENQMTSVERVIEYTKLNQEPPKVSHPRPPKNWPQNGAISFQNVSFGYTADKAVLKNLNFSIEAREKIGVVGRTGAGKSSLIQCLFRMADPSGKVVIDDIDINSIGLHDLRSKLSIIPQDPVLFCGSLRKNLDPFGQYEDADLWKALDEVQLKRHLQESNDGSNAASGLDFEFSEGGSNFSVGQRQLICLARAVLKKCKVLVMDEATANVDHDTDELIQNTIRSKFSDCTVITIAHRLNTIIDSDRILVMKDGLMEEFDEPHTLLTNPNSLLTTMVQNSDVNAPLLFKLACEAYKRKHVIGD